MVINYKVFNPLAFHLLRYLQDRTIRFIFLYGGSSSGKTFSVAQIILIYTLWEGSNTLILRKVATSIKDTIYQSFKAAAETLGITNRFKFSDGIKVVTCLENGARIVFKGLDDQEKIKGLESFKRVVMEELNEFEENDHKQIRKRLRGKEGQQILHMFNPVDEDCWIKRKIYDTQKWHDVPMEVEIAGKRIPVEFTTVKSIRMNESRSILNPRTKEIEEKAPNTVLIQSTYLNNFWVVGSPDGTYGYYDEQCVADFEFDREHDPDYFNVYALGEWGVIRTGSEFFGAFNSSHIMEIGVDPNLPIHISVDNNVLPYISFTFWQIDTNNGTHIRQIDEVCAESPDNTVRKAAKLVAKRINSLTEDRLVYLHGDASTRAANTIDEEKRSWLDLLIDALNKEGIEVVDCVGTQNPSVPMSGEFINAIYERAFKDIDITISDRCKVSIVDYMRVQKDVNGAILKSKVKNKTTMQTYEEYGHLSDTKRYLVVDVLRDEFTRFSMKRKRNLYAHDGALHFYNPITKNSYTREVCYVMPNINGKCVFLMGRLCGNKWHITDAVLMDSISTDEITKKLADLNCRSTVVECAPTYYRFATELRKSLPGVRVRPEITDFHGRIAATADFVKNHILFNEERMNSDTGYSRFMTSLLDYNKDSDNIEASAVLSGFVQFVVKFGFDAKGNVNNSNTIN